MNRHAIVGVDFGSSRIKAAAYGADGELLGVAAVDTPVLGNEDPTEFDFPTGSMLAASIDAIRRLGMTNGSIRALAITSMGEVGTLLKDGQLIDLRFPAWYDARGREEAERAETKWGADWLKQATGRHLRATSTAAKLSSIPDTPSGLFLGIAGALAWSLTGEAWQEVGLATSSGVYDVTERAYMPQVWSSLGLASVLLPDVRPPGYWAPASTALAHDLGMEVGAPVMIAGHDHPVASIGAGALIGEVVDSIGTGEAVIAAIDPSLASRKDYVQSVPDRDPYLSVEMWPSTGDPAVVWERMRPGLAMRTFLESSDFTRDELDLGSGQPSSDPVIDDATSLSLESGVRCSIDYGAGNWGGLIDFYTMTANRGEQIVRAATGAEGLLLLTGGGLRSRRWRTSRVALATDAFLVSTAVETATRGCAALAGVALGWWPDAESMPGIDRVLIEPGAYPMMEEVAEQLFGRRGN